MLGNIIALTLNQIIAASTLNWKQCTNMGTASLLKEKSANKISIVKCKENNPSFQKPQNPTVPLGQQQDSAKEKKRRVMAIKVVKSKRRKGKKSTSTLLSQKTLNLRVPSCTLCTPPPFHLWLIHELLHINQHNFIKGLLVCLYSHKCRKCLLLPIT